jgi:peptidoglycan/LPS O-acetylase OafA/YrhL
MSGATIIEPARARVIPTLDGLRGLAILIVMIHHFTYYRPTAGLDLAIGNVVFFGWTGVDLFFVLSGFLITGILLDSRGSERYFTNFYARRILRIFPLYFLVLFIAFVVLPMFPVVNEVLIGHPELPPQWPYWSFLTNVFIAEAGWVHGWVDVAWSLAIEEHFYLIWPLLIWLCPPRVVAVLCASIIVAEPVARIFARESGMQALPIYVLTWFRLDGLAVGALLAVAHRRGLFPSLDRWVPAIVIAGVASLVVFTIMGGHTWWWNRWMQQYGYSVIAIVGGAMLVGAVNRPADSWWPRTLSAGWLRSFGKYSYAMYLIHAPVMRAVREWVFNPEEFAIYGIAPWNAQVLFYVAATVPTFALAWLSWHFFEGPILRLRGRYPSASPSARLSPISG